MKSVIALVAVAGLSAAASASPLTGLFKWEASSDGGATWSSAVTVTEGNAFKVRGVVSWTDDATPSIGFAGATFDEINFAGASQSELSGFASLFKLQGTAETWAMYDVAGGVKIDNFTNPTTNRTNFGQLPQTLPGGVPNPNFLTSNPLQVFTMDMTAGAGAHNITLSGTWTRLGTPATNEFKVYTTSTGTNKKPTTEAVQSSATITVVPVPAPASMALLGLGGLVAGRRRR